MNAHTHLWNDMPFAERKRLMPYMIEAQILHAEQAKLVMVRNHKRAMDEMNALIKNLNECLRKETAEDANVRVD